MEVDLPEEFRCPISLEVMRDPVILTWSGQTYDRPSIQRWLDSGSRTCPLTNTPAAPAPLPSSYPQQQQLLIPNHALRRLISTFVPSPSPSPDADGAKSLQQQQQLFRALDLASSLSFPSDAASLSQLLRLVKRGGAAARRRVAEGAVDALAAALASPSAALAATTLTSLAVVEVNKCTIGAHPAAIPRLAALLLRRGAGAPRERREAATALYELCKFPENRRRAVRAGAVPPLVAFAAAGSERAVEVLGLIAKCQEGRQEMNKGAGRLIRVLCGVLRAGSPRGVENALLVLNLVCSYSEEMAAEAIEEGALDLCLPHLAEARNGKIAKNASGLAQTLQKMQLSGFV
ncbi:U-box domain-containing protein 8-like isoform X2 [Ananas comosus]|uniref:RING-type E3 ubiquitin transferase n=1 Tax=Ananas comosus TaxID=4615 RepID=A0A6P5FWR8_ANACO|nr:U-box domain-containing protein 8-like isoform X2 [Ananas comosus]